MNITRMIEVVKLRFHSNIVRAEASKDAQEYIIECNNSARNGKIVFAGSYTFDDRLRRKVEGAVYSPQDQEFVKLMNEVIDKALDIQVR